MSDHAFRDAAKPFERLLIAGSPIDFRVTVTPISQHGFDALFIADEPLVMRPDRFQHGLVDEAEMVPVGVILRQHFPVSGVTMLDPTGGEFEFAFRREITRTVDELGGGAKMFLKRNAGRTKTGEDEATITGDARG